MAGQPQANMCPIIVVGQPEANVCPIVVIGQLKATGDALKGVISGWYLSTVRERTLAKNLMLIAIANLGLQQSAAVGLSKQKDWEIDWRNKIWTAEYRVQICIHKFPQQSDFISFAISYTSWISTCKLIKLSASKNLSPINFSSYWIYKQ